MVLKWIEGEKYVLVERQRLGILAVKTSQHLIPARQPIEKLAASIIIIFTLMQWRTMIDIYVAFTSLYRTKTLERSISSMFDADEWTLPDARIKLGGGERKKWFFVLGNGRSVAYQIK